MIIEMHKVLAAGLFPTWELKIHPFWELKFYPFEFLVFIHTEDNLCA